MITVTLTGNLGRDAEVKTLPSGKTLTNLSVGTTPRIKRNGEWEDGETIWFNVTVWQALPEVLFAKGQTVLITGALSQRTYEKDGVTKIRLEITSDAIGVVNKGHNLGAATKFPISNSEPVWAAPLDDMPF